MRQRKPEYGELIRRLCTPLTPTAANTEVRLGVLPDLRAVLFDVYGTLLVSTADSLQGRGAAPPRAFAESLRAARIVCDATLPGEEVLWRGVEEARHAARDAGEPHPEVDIRAVWRDVLNALQRRGLVSEPVTEDQIATAAVEFECRTNPVWPMPHALEAITALHARGLVLGVVSNAQFYTPHVLEALLGASLTDLGFHPRVRVWSYEHGVGKPSSALWREAARRLRAEAGLNPSQALAIGNSGTHDVAPAAATGFRTALFAGDTRAYRPAAGVRAELVLTDLAQLPACLGG